MNNFTKTTFIKNSELRLIVFIYNSLYFGLPTFIKNRAPRKKYIKY